MEKEEGLPQKSEEGTMISSRILPHRWYRSVNRFFEDDNLPGVSRRLRWARNHTRGRNEELILDQEYWQLRIKYAILTEQTS